MIQGIYYKEWSRMLGRDMEFKVYGHAGTPVLALPARGGRFYDWENNGMPDAIDPLLNEGKVQLFCADRIDAESLLAGDTAPRRRAEMQEKYFNYLTSELAPRILTLNGAKKDTLLWAVGVDTGAYQAVNCRLRRPKVFAGAIGLSGLYDVSRFLGNAADDLVLRNAPLSYLAEDGLVDKKLLAKAEENALLLCAGQGSYEGDALVDTQAMADALRLASSQFCVDALRRSEEAISAARASCQLAHAALQCVPRSSVAPAAPAAAPAARQPEIHFEDDAPLDEEVN